MSNRDKEVIFYKKLREELSKTSNWPTNYMFKFIVPTDITKIQAVEESFLEYPQATINRTPSSKGNYTSVSIKVRMQSPEHVIARYKSVNHIKGIISL